MRKSLTNFVCGAALALLVNSGQSHAAVIVSNLSDPVAGAGTIYASGPPQDYAQEFLTGTQSVQLGSIIAALGTAAGSYTASAELVANNGGSPGSTVLTSFTVPSIPTSTPVDLTFIPTTSVTLSANTDYWFILSASGTGDYKWQYTDTVRAALPHYAFSHDGVTWTIENGGPFLIEADSTGPQASAPEPASLVLVGFTGLLGFVVVLHRRLRHES